MFQKPIILFDSETNREVTKHFNIDRLVYFFSDFEEINDLIFNAVCKIKYPTINRDWRDVAKETMEFMENVMAQPIDFKALNGRFAALRQMEYIFKEPLKNSF